MFSFESIPRFTQNSLTGVVAVVIFITSALILPAAAKDSKAEAAYQAAAFLFDNTDWQSAALAYEKYFKNHPKHFQAGLAHYGLGLCYFNMKNYVAAAKELESATGSKAPPPVETNLYLGQALMKKTPAVPKRAERAFESSLLSLGLSKTGLLNREWGKKKVTEWLDKTKEAKKKQLAAEVVQGLLEATYKQQNWKSLVKKVDVFEGLIKSSRVEQRALALTGEAHEKLENYKEAAGAYKAAANLKGSDASEALFRLGFVSLNYLQDFEAAANYFNEFSDQYKSDSKQPKATFNAAVCYFKSYSAGKKPHHAKAIELFGDFVQANPNHELVDTAQFNLGKLQHIRGDWMAAVKALEPLMGKQNLSSGELVFLVADSYHRLENWDKSAELYMRFAKGNEKALNADVALINAGVAYSKLKKPDTENAISAYKLLENNCPNSPHLSSVCLMLGRIYFDNKRFEEAKKSLQKIPGSHVLKADADYLLSWVDLDNGKPIDAARGFRDLSKRLFRTTPKHRLIPLSNLYQGTAEFEGKRFAGSAQTLSEFVSAFPDHGKLDEAAYNLGLAQMELKMWDDAVKSFELVPENSNLHDRSLYGAASSKRYAAKPGGAIPYYKALLEQHATSSLVDEVAFQLAEVEFEIGSEKGGNPQHVEDSVNRLMALLKKPALNAELRRLAQYQLGFYQFEQKNYPESAKAFEDLLEAGPGNLLIQAAYQAGEARRQTARTAQEDEQERGYRAALKNFEIAVDATKPVPGTKDAELQEQSLIRVGECKWSLGLWEDSQKSFELFIKSNPNHRMVRTAYLGLGMTLFDQKIYPDAIKFFEKTVADLKRDVTGAKAQFMLGSCYLERDRHSEAIIEFAKVESLYKFPKWQSKAAYSLALVHLKKDNRKGARKHFDRLIKLYPDTTAAASAKSDLKLLN